MTQLEEGQRVRYTGRVVSDGLTPRPGEFGTIVGFEDPAHPIIAWDEAITEVWDLQDFEVVNAEDAGDA